jgi:hypothetical protein
MFTIENSSLIVLKKVHPFINASNQLLLEKGTGHESCVFFCHAQT